jgi:hypothetical protein
VIKAWLLIQTSKKTIPTPLRGRDSDRSVGGNQEIKIILKQTAQWLQANWISLALTGAYVALFIFAITTILDHQTTDAIRSPWEVVPRTILFIYFLATLILIALIRRVQKISTALLSAHFFLSFSLVLLVYSVGFGFDPFIHRATEAMLADTGTITPKPYLYVGQYTLVVFLAKLLSLPLALADKWLLPVLASLLIPSLVMFSLKKTFTLTTHHLLLTTLSLLALPVYFIITIPQPFANLLYLVLIFLSFPYLSGRSVPLSLLWGIGIAAFFVHALTGIPALLYLFLITLLSRPAFRFRKSIIVFAPLLGAAAIPGLVALGNIMNGHGIQTAGTSLPFPALALHYLPFLSLAHTAELWHRALPALFLIAACAGTVLLWKHGRRGLTIVPWLTALSLAISYFLVRSVNLSAIITYEQAEFTERILEIIGITILPFFTYFLLFFSKKVIEGDAVVEENPPQPARAWSPGRLGGRAGEAERPGALAAGTRVFATTAHRFVAPIVLTSLITISFYYAYPRVDAFAKSRGFSVSQTDTEAAQWIEDNSAGEAYVVLANQSVAAAALQELGFKQYFNTPQGALFYYPIPTSSPLYQYYLDMVYKEASRATMLHAMELTGVNRAYFVLNSYWLDAEKIAARAAQDANSLQRFEGNVVFVYIKN